MAGLQDDFILIAPNGSRIGLAQGLMLYAQSIPGFQASFGPGPFAQVSSNPNNPQIQGITNLSRIDWNANIPGKGYVRIAPGKTVRLEHGLTLDMGPLHVRIEQNRMRSSVVVRPQWRIRITNGAIAGSEYQLTPGRHCLGSGPTSDIRIADPLIASQQAELNVFNDHVIVSNLAYGGGISVFGGVVQTANLGSGDEFSLNGRSFQLTNPALAATRASPLPLMNVTWNYRTIGGLMAGMALAFIVLFVLTRVTNLIPALLFTVSAVVPVTAIAYLVEKYDKTGISLRTLAGSFLFGGTLGILSAILLEWPAASAIGALALMPVMAGAIEEPAKLFATFWRWNHPVYDRPMDGLIIGSACGFGFAMFETAGYGLTNLLRGGVEGLIVTLVLRSFLSPFGHGLWTGITGAAFWECGRDPRRVIHDPRFQKAMLIAIGLHVLWDCSMIFGMIPGMTLLPILGSAVLSVRIYKRLLERRGYST
jgi:RsiW-degrading membrane proteinase PrsW (M82 family)